MAKRRRKKGSRKASKASKVSNVSNTSPPAQSRFRLAWKDFFLFLLLFVITYSIYKLSKDSLLMDLFGLLSALTGLLALTFFIVLAALWLIRLKQ